MALFNKSQEAGSAEQEARNGQSGAQAFNASTAAGADEFLNQFAGEGLEGFTADTVSTPWISIMQDKTQHVLDGLCDAGVWRNSATGDVYGKALRIIPVSFKVIWNERDDDTGKTVGNYEPGSIATKLLPPKGGRGFPKRINPETQNRIDETFLYAVVLADAPQEGYALLQASMGSIGTFKRWNAQLRAQVLPNGAKAPLFAYVWELLIGDAPARNANGQLYYKLADVRRGDLVSKQLFIEGVQPNRQLALTAQMALAAPSDDVHAERIEE
jgi:hypothetical protein